MDGKRMEELARRIEATGNVTAACAGMGIARSVYYKWLARMGRAPAERRRHPQSMSDEIMAAVLDLAGLHPEWGCDRISHYLLLHGKIMSGTSIQKFLASRGLGKMGDRMDHARKRADSVERGDDR